MALNNQRIEIAQGANECGNGIELVEQWSRLQTKVTYASNGLEHNESHTNAKGVCHAAIHQKRKKSSDLKNRTQGAVGKTNPLRVFSRLDWNQPGRLK